jgi:hypothetical protein
LTAEAVSKAAGDARRFVIPDLKAEGLMRCYRP